MNDTYANSVTAAFGLDVMPAQAGIQVLSSPWIPAFAGMTNELEVP